MSKMQLNMQNRANYAKNHRLSEAASTPTSATTPTSTSTSTSTSKVETPLPPITPTLGQAPFRSRRAVVEYYEGPQSPSDDAMLPMPPHNKALSSGALFELLQTKLGIKNIVQKALGLLKRRVV